MPTLIRALYRASLLLLFDFTGPSRAHSGSHDAATASSYHSALRRRRCRCHDLALYLVEGANLLNPHSNSAEDVQINRRAIMMMLTARESLTLALAIRSLTQARSFGRYRLCSVRPCSSHDARILTGAQSYRRHVAQRQVRRPLLRHLWRLSLVRVSV